MNRQTKTQYKLFRSVVAIGNASRDEFRNVVNWFGDGYHFTVCSTTDECKRHLSRSPASPVLILWLQSYLGEFHESDVESIRNREPKSKMACVYGAMSEGELRTGNPLRGMARIPWFAWESRAASLLDDSQEDLSPDPTVKLPSYARAEAPTVPRAHPGDRETGEQVSALVGVASASDEMAELIISACHTAGHVARRIVAPYSTTGPVEVAIWDDSCDARHALIPLDQFAKAIAPAPIIATMSFPRIDQCEQISAHRVRYVLGKPLMIEDLLWQIDLLVSGKAQAAGDPK